MDYEDSDQDENRDHAKDNGLTREEFLPDLRRRVVGTTQDPHGHVCIVATDRKVAVCIAASRLSSAAIVVNA